MYLKIESDIIEEALSKDDEVAVDVLRQAALAIRNGKHAIIIQYADIVKLLKHKRVFSGYGLTTFDKVEKVYTQLGSLTSKMRIKAFVTFSKRIQRLENNIFINPIETGGLEFFGETRLLTENLENAFFFKALTDYYQRKERIKACTTYSCSLMGGGNTTNSATEYEKKLKQHFAFSMADSNFHFQGDNHLGETAKKTQDSLANSPFNYDLYVMNKACEVENLIPYGCLWKSNNLRSHCIVTNHRKFDISFSDMRDEVHIQYLYSDAVFNYWKSELINHILANKFEPIDKE